MKENETYLSLEETERLCRLYLECQLSMLEEAELNFVLGKLPYSTPVIDETRVLMDIALSHNIVNEETSSSNSSCIKKLWPKYLVAAASVTVVLCLGFSIWINTDRQDDFYCQVFENGKKVNRKAARSMAENEMQRIDRFIEQMIDIDRELQAKIDSFNQEQEKSQH